MPPKNDPPVSIIGHALPGRALPECTPGGPSPPTRGPQRPAAPTAGGSTAAAPPFERSTAINPLDEAARRNLGVTFLYPYQKLVVANILEAKNQIVILPTGAGKSLCFQLPARMLSTVTLIVFPLLSLMSDQARRLSSLKIPHALLRGGQSAADREELWSRVSSGEVRVLLTTPEAVMVPRTLARLRAAQVGHLVIDEAHCVSEWGDTFRPAYLDLGRLSDAASIPVVTAFTATASPMVLDRIASVLFSDLDYSIVRGNPDRPNIGYTVVPTLCRDRTVEGLVAEAAGPCVVFCRTRADAELTAHLVRRRLSRSDVRFYHAGLDREEKSEVERWFFDSSDGVLAATCAYGMGVDKSDIRTVIHRDMPPSVEAFLQESGRAGRDRKPSASYLLFAAEDRPRAEAIRDPTGRERLLSLIRVAEDVERCRRRALLSLLDAEPELCFGCDVCSGSAEKSPDGAAGIVRFVAKNRRRYSSTEAALILRGRDCYETVSAGLHRSRGWGRLSGWEPDDIEHAIASMVRDRRLHLVRRGPWRGKLTVERRRRE